MFTREENNELKKTLCLRIANLIDALKFEERADWRQALDLCYAMLDKLGGDDDV
jgi:hypothetical protein